MNFTQRLESHARLLDTRLQHLLLDAAQAGLFPGAECDNRLAQAMNYAAISGGKRFRPFLVMECAALFGTAPENSVDAAAALECVHCYSLVHDDLPCMDNDQLRRGQATVWKAYDEWTAVLAGDALLTFAFEILSRPETYAQAETRLALIAASVTASGMSGMAQGQALDLAASKLGQPKNPNVAQVKTLQALKTGALIETACQFGVIIGNGDEKAFTKLKRYGAALGLAFQISDDLLDLEGNAQKLGKATGKDDAAGKATLVSLLGKDKARQELDAALHEAGEALNSFGASADSLRDVTTFIANRQH